jgi:hypothetical protein
VARPFETTQLIKGGNRLPSHFPQFVRNRKYKQWYEHTIELYFSKPDINPKQRREG